MDSTKWSDPANVKLPFKDPRYLGSDMEWGRINSALTDLKSKCEMFQVPHDAARYWLRDCVYKYNHSARLHNFNIIQDNNEIVWPLITLLPDVINHALSLPTRLENPINILKHGENRGVKLNRNIVCSLIANAFLCTFPKQEKGRTLPYFNFWRIYNDEGSNALTKSVKREKIKCFMEYFKLMGNGTQLPNTTITYERLSIETGHVNWESSSFMLADMQIISGSRIEDADEMLQVDFANMHIGGGVLSEGAVQEEIRFCINPELVAARLFTERLACNEAVIITGTRRFSDYLGYGSSVEGQTFRFRRLSPETDNNNSKLIPGDKHLREFTRIVAIDAINYSSDKNSQYKKEKIDRELHKSYVGFYPRGGSYFTTIATGNWGCGAFNGDPDLKFLIQWMAASQHNRPVLYHARDSEQKAGLDLMKHALVTRNVTVGKLYNSLIQYESRAKTGDVRLPVCKFVINSLNN